MSFLIASLFAARSCFLCELFSELFIGTLYVNILNSNNSSTNDNSNELAKGGKCMTCEKHLEPHCKKALLWLLPGLCCSWFGKTRTSEPGSTPSSLPWALRYCHCLPNLPKASSALLQIRLWPSRTALPTIVTHCIDCTSAESRKMCWFQISRCRLSTAVHCFPRAPPPARCLLTHSFHLWRCGAYISQNLTL